LRSLRVGRFGIFRKMYGQVRKMALSLLRAAPEPRTSGKKRKMTGPKRQFTAAMNPGYMLTVFFGK
jgi:hypothetical protein